MKQATSHFKMSKSTKRMLAMSKKRLNPGQLSDLKSLMIDAELVAEHVSRQPFNVDEFFGKKTSKQKDEPVTQGKKAS